MQLKRERQHYIYSTYLIHLGNIYASTLYISLLKKFFSFLWSEKHCLQHAELKLFPSFSSLGVEQITPPECH